MVDVQSQPLSLLVEHLAGGGPRDDAFVRALGAWLHEHAAYLRMPHVEDLGLVDVVVTLRMKGRVALVLTGHHPERPGEITIRVDERDFPFVPIEVVAHPVRSPYSFCTLDYAHAGRAVRTNEGRVGQLVVSAIVDGREEHRVRLDDGVLTVSGDALAFCTD